MWKCAEASGQRHVGVCTQEGLCAGTASTAHAHMHALLSTAAMDYRRESEHNRYETWLRTTYQRCVTCHNAGAEVVQVLERRYVSVCAPCLYVEEAPTRVDAHLRCMATRRGENVGHMYVDPEGDGRVKDKICNTYSGVSHPGMRTCSIRPPTNP